MSNLQNRNKSMGTERLPITGDRHHAAHVWKTRSKRYDDSVLSCFLLKSYGLSAVLALRIG